MREEYVEAVLAVAELIPSGFVLSYGDIAALLESGGPRQVGAVMSAQGSAVAWWRVIRSNGAPPALHDASALRHYRQEQTALRGDTLTEPGRVPAWRVDMTVARWNPSDAELDKIDVIAALLLAADDVDSLASAGGGAGRSAPRASLEPDVELEPDGATVAEAMSVPRDGLKA